MTTSSGSQLEGFHNPYHFVPVKDQDGNQGHLARDAFQNGKPGHVTHDRFLTETGGENSMPVHSGRLICKLTIEDPVVVGGQQEEPEKLGGPKRILPFQLEGKPAIPASSLRGLISSLAEAASNSALRVLEDKSYSRRADWSARESLSAIGMIMEEADGEGMKLLPLALPTMVGPTGRNVQLESRFRQMFPAGTAPQLKVYVGKQTEIRSESFDGDLPFRSYNHDRPEFFYAKLAPHRWANDHSIPFGPFQNRKRGGATDYLVSQLTTDGQQPIPASELPPDEEERKQYTRGILRVLGISDAATNAPTKKHELFIPYPDDLDMTRTVPISPDALATFYELAKESADASDQEDPRPYMPRGTRSASLPKGTRFVLKQGDLVYFLPNGRGSEVEEIAMSSIWRKPLLNTHQYFSRISPELLPFNQKRTQISIAEALFGFVEENANDGQMDRQQDDRQALALAGRIRLSFGMLHPDPGIEKYYEKEYDRPLKILSSPKPPLPAFYFKNRDGRAAYISKDGLNSQNRLPQGRKFYVHHPPLNPAATPWLTERTDNMNQKVRVTPMKPGLSFYFHLDFVNLSQQELGMLCYAIQPTPEFRHKLGMGKPLGLGKVQIEPAGLFYIDRKKRYTESLILDEPRYHAAWVSDDVPAESWPDRYATECAEASIGIGDKPGLDALSRSFRLDMDTEIRQALEILGDPKVELPVHTPQVAEYTGTRVEHETFKWFVENDKVNNPQFLEPLPTKDGHLPVLKRTLPEEERQRGSRDNTGRRNRH